MSTTAFIHYGLNKNSELIIVCYHEVVTSTVKYRKFSTPYELDKLPSKLSVTIENPTAENIKKSICQQFKELKASIEKKGKSITELILAADVNLCFTNKEELAEFLIDDNSLIEIFGDIPTTRVLESSLSHVVIEAVKYYEETTAKDSKNNHSLIIKTKSGGIVNKGKDEASECYGREPSPRLREVFKGIPAWNDRIDKSNIGKSIMKRPSHSSLFKDSEKSAGLQTHEKEDIKIEIKF